MVTSWQEMPAHTIGKHSLAGYDYEQESIIESLAMRLNYCHACSILLPYQCSVYSRIGGGVKIGGELMAKKHQRTRNYKFVRFTLKHHLARKQELHNCFPDSLIILGEL